MLSNKREQKVINRDSSGASPDENSFLHDQSRSLLEGSQKGTSLNSKKVSVRSSLLVSKNKMRHKESQLYFPGVVGNHDDGEEKGSF